MTDISALLALANGMNPNDPNMMDGMASIAEVPRMLQEHNELLKQQNELLERICSAVEKSEKAISDFAGKGPLSLLGGRK